MPIKVDFFQRVWDIVAQIPVGKVTTYGHIAEYLGSRSAARTVGWALKAAKGTSLPCHRVVNRYGALSGAKQFGGPQVMEYLLRSEKITFNEEGCVVIARHLWVPAQDHISEVSTSQKPGNDTEAASAP